MKPFCPISEPRKARLFGRTTIVFRIVSRFYSGRIFHSVSRPIFENKCCDRSIMSAVQKALFYRRRKSRGRNGGEKKKTLVPCIIVPGVYRNLFGVVGRVREFLWDEISNKYGKYLCSVHGNNKLISSFFFLSSFI